MIVKRWPRDACTQPAETRSATTRLVYKRFYLFIYLFVYSVICLFLYFTFIKQNVYSYVVKVKINDGSKANKLKHF